MKDLGNGSTSDAIGITNLTDKDMEDAGFRPTDNHWVLSVPMNSAKDIHMFVWVDKEYPHYATGTLVDSKVNSYRIKTPHTEMDLEIQHSISLLMERLKKIGVSI